MKNYLLLALPLGHNVFHQHGFYIEPVSLQGGKIYIQIPSTKNGNITLAALNPPLFHSYQTRSYIHVHTH